jgi:hypothetical protein
MIKFFSLEDMAMDAAKLEAKIERENQIVSEKLREFEGYLEEIWV